MRFLLLAILFLLPSAGAIAAPDATVAATDCDRAVVGKVKAALGQGKQVLIVAWSNTDKCGAEDESCGDWVDRLNKFKDKQKDKLETFEVPLAHWKQVVSIPGAPISKQSELFLLQNHPSYFYAGPILESEVYQAVIGAWTGPLRSELQQFLPQQVSVKFRQ